MALYFPALRVMFNPANSHPEIWRCGLVHLDQVSFQKEDEDRKMVKAKVMLAFDAALNKAHFSAPTSPSPGCQYVRTPPGLSASSHQYPGTLISLKDMKERWLRRQIESCNA